MKLFFQIRFLNHCRKNEGFFRLITISSEFYASFLDHSKGHQLVCSKNTKLLTKTVKTFSNLNIRLMTKLKLFPLTFFHFPVKLDNFIYIVMLIMNICEYNVRPCTIELKREREKKRLISPCIFHSDCIN